MRYGKIRIEDGNIYFSAHMISNSIPCEELVWAYHRRESSGSTASVRKLVANYLVVVTRKGRQYQFDMSEKEVLDCLQVLSALNPKLAVGYPQGSRILLQDLPNTRDLGGLKTSDGRHILPGRLIRSGELYHISMSDQYTLEHEYRVHTVIDLRSATERRLRPDDPLSNVANYHIPLVDEGAAGFFEERTLMDMISSIEGDPETYMQNQYIRMIRDPYTVGQIARVIETIRSCQEGAVLWHCTFGKDRTDVITALLLCILGVPKETVLREYERSNVYLASEKEYAMELMLSRGFEPELIGSRLDAIYEVQGSYLRAMFRAIEEDHESISRFLRRGLYLTPRTVEDLCERYLI